ncbi:hypothetical protein [Burkholderia sp. IDO3]|uniref:hypothetical protein n=1 Tax=Burkholderia sp. IDO3 TaxID=1705310 RepID=UPI000BBAAC3C|nr:hypothetical protein [Burkholderia sp. IDO3]AXK62596.1 hypothetical protein DCN14_08005 [Burkholderia sp. IDO3]PCD63270.1 hypothetical protein CN645_02480 [Burkholderia sp. IDO3]
MRITSASVRHPAADIFMSPMCMFNVPPAAQAGIATIVIAPTAAAATHRISVDKLPDEPRISS